ncbi:hypothetical protein NLI96_g1795 [Meripilus lineatus]|uniref:Uncharacterized protein n=1 Tax=Meripilus lineatus TaxID=2056292 RepID=A0AAD5VE79_9APHY|nr:hypothetical protein NLI96_g1795 [Physisporinus lineatus]
MPDWNSPEEIAADAVIFVKVMHCVSGLYIWEYAVSLDFEWSFLSGKKRFNWPMLFYFLGRYFALFSTFGIEIDCQALYQWLAIGGQFTVGLASINLAIRAMVIWSMNRYVVGSLCLIIAGHWAVLMQGVIVKAVWVPGSGCVTTAARSRDIAASFIYSVCLDFVVLVLCGWKLFRSDYSRSQLMNMMFRDGLFYFVIASFVNLPAAVISTLGLNQVMDIMFDLPAALISMAVACRAVRRLSNFSHTTPAIYMTTTNPTSPSGRSREVAPFGIARTTSDGVHVQMDTYVVSDDAQSERVSNKDIKLDSFERRKTSADIAV